MWTWHRTPDFAGPMKKLEETFCDFNDEKGVNTVYIVDTVDTVDTVDQSILSLRRLSIFMWSWHGTPDVAGSMRLGETFLLNYEKAVESTLPCRQSILVYTVNQHCRPKWIVLLSIFMWTWHRTLDVAGPMKKLEETFCEFNEKAVDTVDNLDNLDTVDQNRLSHCSPSIFMWTWHGTPDVAGPMKKLEETFWPERGVSWSNLA